MSEKLMLTILCYVICVFFFAIQQKLIQIFEAETIVKKLRSRIVKCPMSHGY